MAHGRPRDPDKEQFWRDTIARWQQSGLSIRAFCQRHHLTDTQLHAWRRRLRLRDATAFLPVHLLADTTPAPTTLELVLPGGRSLRIAPGFDPATLRQLLAVLEEDRVC